VKPYYQDETVTIYHGDCTELLGEIDMADLFLTDPPYGVGFRGHGWDAEIPQVAPTLPERIPRGAIVTAPTTMWDYPRPDWVCAWTRSGATSRTKLGTFNHWSPILVYGGRAPNPDLLQLPGSGYASGENSHPSPKPRRLMEWLVVGMSDEGETILDPFMGSGTTLRAAKDLGRKAIGIEIEERYCEIAAKRMEQGVLPL
jgi:site-specific DNA-methyltransferase (adenine-specific)